ncbi:hypothetical protein RQP46_006092 [Phenoliferia psychrophenolica]
MSVSYTHHTLIPACSNCISQRQDSPRRPTQVNVDELKRCHKCFSVGLNILYCNATCQKEAWPHHKVFCGKPRPPPSFQRPTQRLLTKSPAGLRQLSLLEHPSNAYDYYFIPGDSDDISPIGVTIADPVLAKEFRECLFTVLTGRFGNALDDQKIQLMKPGTPDALVGLGDLMFLIAKRHGKALGMIDLLQRAVADDGTVFSKKAWHDQLEVEHGLRIDWKEEAADGSEAVGGAET